MKRTSTFFAGLAAVLLLAAGCASTRVVSTWVQSGDQSASMQNVLVVSLMGGRFTGIQQQFETDAVAALQKNGVNAISSIDRFGPAAFENMKQEDMLAKMVSTGSTSILIISLLDREKTLNWVPGTVYYSNRMRFPYTSPWGWQYAWGFDVIYRPGYYTIDTNYILDARLYSLTGDGGMIYSVQTSTINPSSHNRLSRDFSRVIMRDMQTHGLIKSQK